MNTANEYDVEVNVNDDATELLFRITSRNKTPISPIEALTVLSDVLNSVDYEDNQRKPEDYDA